MKFVLGIVIATGVALIAIPASAAPLSGSHIRNATVLEGVLQRVQSTRYCEGLRQACQNKEARGESGAGNCRRYRDECGGHASHCEGLRQACQNKDARGEVGEGNCRRYRQECGGRTSY